MLVKWIRADAVDRSGFDRGQRAWREVAGSPGLLGQGGGWSSSTPGTAVVVALWRDRDAHRAFLDTGHDAIAAAQRDSYRALAVDLLDVVVRGGPDDGSFPMAGVLRTAWCPLRPGRDAHALDVQRRVWFPAMRDAGMTWGLVARSGPDARADGVLVLSRWPSRSVHERYRTHVPDLRAAAGADDDFSRVDGDLVELEPGWSTLAPDTV